MTVHQASYTKEEIRRLGEEIYHREIRFKVMPQEKGRFLLLDIETGDCEVDEEDLLAVKRLRSRRPKGTFYGLRVGSASAYALSGRIIEHHS